MITPDSAPGSKPSVLFMCVHNAGRSQMAAGYLRALAGDRIDVRSAGSSPG
jgi:arsenate reductase (thioredoxin)